MHFFIQTAISSPLESENKKFQNYPLKSAGVLQWESVGRKFSEIGSLPAFHYMTVRERNIPQIGGEEIEHQDQGTQAAG